MMSRNELLPTKVSPADGPPVDDPAELRLAPATAPGWVRRPGAAGHLHHATPSQQGQLRPQSAGRKQL